tara:strand:- start:1156 stop:1518 length:363 start_codon:yes stop_codon:yes gene_type:complete
LANKYTRIPNEKLFVKNSSYKNYTHLKNRIIKENLIPYECAFCGNEGEWKKKNLSLVLDHINGVKKDNRLENLRFVCPNCDSQLPTFKSKNIKYQRDNNKFNYNLNGYDPTIYKKSNECE